MGPVAVVVARAGVAIEVTILPTARACLIGAAVVKRVFGVVASAETLRIRRVLESVRIVVEAITALVYIFATSDDATLWGFCVGLAIHEESARSAQRAAGSARATGREVLTHGKLVTARAEQQGAEGDRTGDRNPTLESRHAGPRTAA
jgi:hypothetical protein